MPNRCLFWHVRTTWPGNVLRPDRGRSTQCCYFTLLEFPYRLLVSDLGWMTAVTARSTLVQEIPGQLSGLMAAFLSAVWPGSGHCLAKHGFRFSLPDGAEHHLRVEYAGTIADERALKELLCVKGASGSKPCFCCKNLLLEKQKTPHATPTTRG